MPDKEDFPGREKKLRRVLLYSVLTGLPVLRCAALVAEAAERSEGDGDDAMEALFDLLGDNGPGSPGGQGAPGGLDALVAAPPIHRTPLAPGKSSRKMRRGARK
jgi:hypothetical protein